MNKKQDIWDKYQLWKVGYGIIIGMILIGTMFYFVTKDRDYIPESEDGQTFISLNVKHCSSTFNKQCWINNDEIEEFKKSNEWDIMVDFPDKKIVYR